ncbi:MAG: excinuclease ABC subunit UvrC [Candidatus Omnitrophica bacterium]|nr:excinuclease ABC subunit UvrC [Candidatus Omnitrophota bacterium]
MVKISEKLRDRARTAPDAAGVYLMKDSCGNVLYVGKAKSLKKRLKSYFTTELADKTMNLMSNVSDIEWQLTPTEPLALLLESNLIKKYTPKYNVSLRDDKSFPLVKITNEEFPAIYITRKKESDGSRYFGPYTSAKLLRVALKTIRKYFPYRSCRQLPRRECAYYQIGLSPAPCTGKIKKLDYAKTIENIALILEGRTEDLIRSLSKEMERCAKEQDFEKAAKIRDRISGLSSLGIISTGAFKEELEDLKNLLKLQKPPERIEAFDISDIKGEQACGSMVSFYKGTPDKNNYRRFRIKTVHRVDDYKMLSEVVYRRYSRLKAENLPFPDLILIDGGKQHLLTAKKELEKLKLNIPLVSIAKERENIYNEYTKKPIRLKSDRPALNLIRRVRNEAHRFAVSYHHILRRKKIIGK